MLPQCRFITIPMLLLFTYLLLVRIDVIEIHCSYYGGGRGFEEVFEMLSRSCKHLLAYIREVHDV